MVRCKMQNKLTPIINCTRRVEDSDETKQRSGVVVHFQPLEVSTHLSRTPPPPMSQRSPQGPHRDSIISNISNISTASLPESLSRPSSAHSSWASVAFSNTGHSHAYSCASLEKAKLEAKLHAQNDPQLMKLVNEPLPRDAPKVLRKFQEIYTSKQTIFDAPLGQGKWDHPMVLEEDDKFFFLDGKFMKRLKEKEKRTKLEQREKKMKELCEWPEYWKKPPTHRNLPSECTFRPQTSFDVKRPKEAVRESKKKRMQSNESASILNTSNASTTKRRRHQKRATNGGTPAGASTNQSATSSKIHSSRIEALRSTSPTRTRSKSTALPRINDPNAAHKSSRSSSRTALTSTSRSAASSTKRLKQKSPKRRKGRSSRNKKRLESDTLFSTNGSNTPSTTVESLHHAPTEAHIDPDAVYSLFMFAPKRIPVLPSYYSAENAPALNRQEPHIVASSVESTPTTPQNIHGGAMMNASIPRGGTLEHNTREKMFLHGDGSYPGTYRSDALTDDEMALSSRASSATFEHQSDRGLRRIASAVEGWNQ